jgi:protein-disulfide isomerase
MPLSRRAYLAAGGASLASVTGCLGGSSGTVPDCPEAPEGTVSEMPRPTLGDPDASVTVAVYEDFACPHCATFSLDVFPSVLAGFVDDGSIRYEHHDFPLPVNKKWSWAAASAARAVQDAADDETFFEYVHDLYENQQNYSMSLVSELADGVGVTGCVAEVAAQELTYEPYLRAERRRAQDRGVPGTPAVYVDGQRVEASPDAIEVAVARRL